MNVAMFIFLQLVSIMAFASPDRPSGKVFIPKGFDENDPVEFIISGRLPNRCHRNPSFEVLREGSVFNVSMSSYQVPLEDCGKLELPFVEKVTLGMLPEGQYSIKLLDFRTVIDQGSVIVEPSVSRLRDNFNYGNVTGIREIAHGKVELLGTNPFNCLEFEKLEVKRQGQVIVLLPHFVEVGECLEKPKPFSIDYQIPKHLKGEVLLHVRVMDGRSFNFISMRRD